MRELFRQRLGKHTIEMTKYLRYVLNDFFLLALMFFVGGLGLGYSNLLKTLNTDVWWSEPLAIIVLGSVIQLGGLATLFQRADKIFLLPREVDFRQYLSSSFVYSYLMAMIVPTLTWFILLPFLRVTQHITVLNAGLLLLELWLAKYLLLRAHLFRAYQLRKSNWQKNLRWTFLNGFVYFIVFFNYFDSNIPVWAIITIVATIVSIVLNELQFKKNCIGVLNWNHLIATEDHRMHRIYSFFNMFTDVPQLAGRVKRRKYLNPILNVLVKRSSSPYMYLYLHGVIRDGETSGLYLRLTVIGTFLLFFISQAWLSIAIGLLFIYLIVFQLIPFYFHFSNNVFTHLYPLNLVDQLKSFQRILTTLFTVTLLLFTVGIFFGTHQLTMGLGFLILGIVEGILLIKGYVPRRIKKEIN